MVIVYLWVVQKNFTVPCICDNKDPLDNAGIPLHW